LSAAGREGGAAPPEAYVQANGTGGGSWNAGAGAPGRADLMVRVSRGLIYLGMLLLPLTRLKLGNSLDISDAVFAVAAGVLAVSVRPPVAAWRTSGWHLGGLLVVVGGILASFDAVSPFGSLKVVADGVFVIFVWQWATRQLLDNEHRTQTAISALVLGVGVSSAVAIGQSLHHHVITNSGSSERAAGLTQQANIAGVTFALGLVLAVGLVLDRGRGKLSHRVILIVIIGLALMFTGSVSGMAAALVGLVVLLARRGIRFRNLLAAVVVIFGIYYAGTHIEVHFGSSNLNPFARIQATTGQNTGYNTVNTRFSTIDNAWTGIQDHPVIGHGLDTQSSVVYYDPYLGVSYPTHNFVLLLWYEGGIFTLFGVALMMASVFRRLVRGGRQPTKDMLLAGAVCVVFFAMQAPELFDRWLWVPFVLGLTIRGRDTYIQRAGGSSRSSRSGSPRTEVAQWPTGSPRALPRVSQSRAVRS
jgi:O-Antigen ligase